MNRPIDRGETPGDTPGNGALSELEAAYERASRADGSRPSLSTRASILANAQRAAATRATQVADSATGMAGARAARIAPAAAANDSVWSWRAAAGFAGVAFAGVLALWLYRGNPAPAPVPAPALALQPALPQAETSAVIAPLAKSTARPGIELEEAVAPPAPAALAAPRAAPAPAPTLAPALTQAPEPALTRSAAPPAAAAQPAAPAAEALLQRWFPQALDSDADGLQYWFLLDRNGAVLRSGQRRWPDLPTLQRALASDGTAPHIVRLESLHVLNRRGRDVELAYAWTAGD